MSDLPSPSTPPDSTGGFDFINVKKIVIMRESTGKNSMVVMQLQNTSAVPDLLYAARLEPPCCRVIQTHIVSSTSKMIPVEGIPIYPDSVQRVPDEAPNYHIMLVGLTRDLKGGDQFTIELCFRVMGVLRIENVTVERGDDG